MSTSERRRRMRLFGVPIVILVVAGAIAWWGSQREAERKAGIESFARDLIVAGPSRLEAPPPGLAEAIERLRGAGPIDPDRLRVVVLVTEAGDPRPGSHTALLELDGGPVLGLRVSWRDERDPIIVGYWLPEDEQTP